MKISRREVLILTTLCVTEVICLGALLSPITVGTNIKIQTLTTSVDHAKSLVLWTGAVSALVGGIVFGLVGDRIVRRGVTRTVLMVPGAVVGAVALWVAKDATSIAMLACAWAVAQFSFNAIFAALYGLLIDLFAPDRRRMASAWFAGTSMASLIVSSLVITKVPKTPYALFIPLAIASVVICVIAAVVLREKPTPNVPVATVGPTSPSKAYWLLWTQRLFSQTAYTFVFSFGFNFIVGRQAGSVKDLANAFAVGLGASAAVGMVVAVLAGWVIIPRFGPRPVMYVGGAVLCASTAILIFAASTTVFDLAIILGGAGLGAFFAADLAAVLHVLPAGAEGRYLGLFNVVRTLPQALVPALAPTIWAIGGKDPYGLHTSSNWVSFFSVGTAIALIGVVFIRFLALPEREAVS